MPTRWQYLAEMGQGSLESCLCSESHAYGTVSPKVRIHGSRKQGVDVGVVPLTTVPSDPLAKSESCFDNLMLSWS